MLTTSIKRLYVGRPLRSDRLGETLLPKRIALPVFASDPLSSVAYATQEILLVLALGGLAYLYLAPWVALAVVVLLALVVASYRQVVRAYPSGGGSYEVASRNLGPTAGLVVAAALLVDYVMTVAVSVAAGVDNIVSAVPALHPYRVVVCVGLVALLMTMNLRGVRESGRAFAWPTYLFIAAVLVMVAVGLGRAVAGDPPVAESAGWTVRPEQVGLTGLALVLLALRAFASGCTALTGVEAISNGVPSFRPPKRENAARTMLAMGLVAITLFAGITALALVAHVRVAEDTCALVGFPGDCTTDPQRTAVAQLAAAVFGAGGVGFYLVQATTALVLVLAANTAFNGFPMLGAILADDRYLPRQLHTRGDRLAFSNGIVVLAAVAGGLLWMFDASVTRLVQLYILGVFTSFTVSQVGMVRHWGRALAAPGLVDEDRRRLRRSRRVNAAGAVATGLVLLVVLVTKFTHGAYLVVLAVPLLVLLMRAIRRHYARVAAELEPAPGGIPLPPRVHAVVLVSQLHSPTLQALAYARATRPDTLTALTVAITPDEADALRRAWAERDVPVPLTVLDSPFRDVTGPVLAHVARLREQRPEDLVVVVVPEYVVGRWWEGLLHNQSALRLKARLLFQRRVMVVSVPWQLASSHGQGHGHGDGHGGDEGRGRAGRRPERTPVAASTGAGGTSGPGGTGGQGTLLP
ncbi:APC family permease [Cellulomonas endophytica]|uniref:APC family permease n=1 Tax=Cellulomonas endophytica TaxID=2494735 RepID=UPI00101201A4|nr:APC family permease [Cellulomonas endophytica]